MVTTPGYRGVAPPAEQDSGAASNGIQLVVRNVRRFLYSFNMKLQIDNLDGNGLRDYTSAIDGSRSPQVVRRLNQPTELKFSLVTDKPDFVVPANGARVMLGKTNGHDVFTGYLTQAPVFEYLGWGQRGPVYRYNLVARSDESALDRKRLPNRSPFVDRGGGNALRQLAEDLLPGVFDTSAMQDVDTLLWYPADPQKKWSQHAAEIALQARGSYRATGGVLSFLPVGGVMHAITEGDPNFSADGLSLQPSDGLMNDVTVVGMTEPQDYVKDYFVGDGLSLKFYLSQIPFTRSGRTLLDEEYAGTALDPTRWIATDPSSALTVSNGKLQVAGGSGVDGQSTVVFAEKIELGGALVLQHGDAAFNAASDGVLGGLYPNAISVARLPGGIPDHADGRGIHDSRAGQRRGDGADGQYRRGTSLCADDAFLCDRDVPEAADFSFRGTSRRQWIRRECGGCGPAGRT